MKIKRMRDIAQQILETGTAEFPAPYYRENGPKIVPLRIYEDVFFHANVTDIQRAPVIFLRQWLTRAEILERAATEGWDDDFVTGLLGEEKGQGHEGQSGFDESSTDGTGPGVFDGELDRRRGHYEIVTAYRRSVDEDGIMGIYVTKFSYFLEVPAKASPGDRVVFPGFEKGEPATPAQMAKKKIFSFLWPCSMVIVSKVVFATGTKSSALSRQLLNWLYARLTKRQI
jgi:hypothetical protein